MGEGKKKKTFMDGLVKWGITLPIMIIIFVVAWFILAGPQKVRLLFVNNTDDVYYRIKSDVKFDKGDQITYWLDKSAALADEYGAFEVGEQNGLNIKNEYLPDGEVPEYINLTISVSTDKNRSGNELLLHSVATLKVPIEKYKYSIISITGNEKDGFSAEYMGNSMWEKTTNVSQSSLVNTNK